MDYKAVVGNMQPKAIDASPRQEIINFRAGL